MSTRPLPSPEHVSSLAGGTKGTRQRLVICLDGTWNKRDSGTNVYHLSNRVAEGDVGSGWVQRVYYDTGVGTGALDSVSGGAFGFGLSENIREAYDWLVERYDQDDEIYVFGFSRGAFTARSLVGLVAKCGLLRRGAPISPEQLWRGYRILGRHRHERTGSEPAPNWWERIAGRPEKPFRPIWLLVREPWDEDELAIPVQAPRNLTEALLRTWSRRVKVTCVGVFDTVGSMGVDALAIPWLRDRTAQFHDTHLTSLIVNAFQALAIDEQRANFVHIPWHREISSPLRAGKTWHGGRVEQRWFVGAHSNVGGGYEDDVLAQLPLAWLVEECRRLGLVFREGPRDAPLAASADVSGFVPLLDAEKGAPGMSGKPPRVRDSYAEFASPFWQHVVRVKRQYRRLLPPPELQNGIPVRSVNETLDTSVRNLLAANAECPGATRYLPPNLWESLGRAGTPVGPRPPHRYVESVSSAVWLAIWLGGIAAAGWGIGAFAGGAWRWLALLLPLLAGLVDWRESALYHRAALEPDAPDAQRRLAFMDVCLGLRLGAVAAFALGLGVCAARLGPWMVLGAPQPPLVWLLALDLLLLHHAAARAWCASPMTSAGLSPAALRRQGTPRGVVGCLREWARGDLSPAGRDLLRPPIVRSVWRDLLGRIPASSLFLFVGAWMALSLVERAREPAAAAAPWLPSDRAGTWVTAAALALGFAIADGVAASLYLGYVRRFPEPPGAASVLAAFAASRVALALFFTGTLATALGAAALVMGEIRDVLFGVKGGLSVLAAVVTAFVFYGGVRDLLAGGDGRRAATGRATLDDSLAGDSLSSSRPL